MNKIIELILNITKPKIIFLGILAGAITYLISHNFILSFVILLIVASFYGFLDIWYDERKAIIQERCNFPNQFPIFSDFARINNIYLADTVQEFQYQGFNFKLLRVKDYPPESLSYPLCPKCNGFLIESVKKNFPFRFSIVFKCNSCNVSYPSKLTMYELMTEVGKIHGMF